MLFTCSIFMSPVKPNKTVATVKNSEQKTFNSKSSSVVLRSHSKARPPNVDL